MDPKVKRRRSMSRIRRHREGDRRHIPHRQVKAILCAAAYADRKKLEGADRDAYISRMEDRVIGLTSTKHFSKAKGNK